jgi:uncharacterized protein
MKSCVNSKQELFTLLRSNADSLKAFGIMKLGVFGSFAKDIATEQSDIDFFIDFQPSYKTLKNFIGLSAYLKTLTGRNIEIITPQSLNKFIGKYIIQEVEYVPLAA